MFKKKKKDNIAPEKIISKDLNLYQEIQENDIQLNRETNNVNYHENPPKDELDKNFDRESQIEDIKIKCKFKKELVDNNVILSVNHLKQYFFFGSGANKYKLKAVHDVNFDIKEGECFGLVGESGCGKTTTGRSIIRLYNITSGSIYYKGYRIGAGSRWNEKEIKYTNIRFKDRVKELKTKLRKKEITKEEFDLLYKEALEYKNNVCAVQKAKINQIKKDDTKASELGVNDEAIAKTKARLKFLDKEISYMKDELKVRLANESVNLNVELAKVDEWGKNKRAELKNELVSLKAQNHKLMSEIQMIFQDPVDSLDPRMTVESIISEGLQIQGLHNKAENHKRVVEALEKVGLIADYANRYPHEFSGGQRQRIGIARALVMNPKLLICDEPISALDVSIRAQIINLLNDLKEEMGLSILFIAHDLSVVKYFCDRIAVMYFGEIVELASSDELFRHPLHPYTKSLLSAIPKPNPFSEKRRERIIYKPQECHDYSVNKPKFVEIEPGHFILANEEEVIKYKEEIASIDRNLDEGKSTTEILEETLRNSHHETIEETDVEVSTQEVNEVKEELVEEIKVEVKENEVEEKVTTEFEEETKEEIPTVTISETIFEPSSEIEEESKQDNELIVPTSPDKKVYLLSKIANKWQLELQGGLKVIKTFTTKDEATKYAKALCASQNGELYVKATKGANANKFVKF